MRGMTVAELIRELQAMPNQHARVVVRVDLAPGEVDSGACWFEADVGAAVHEGPYVTIELR